MDWVYIASYLSLLICLRNWWVALAMVAILLSCHFSQFQVSFIATTMCYMPFCLNKNKRVYVTALVMVLFYFCMAIEAHFVGKYWLNDLSYMFITTMLNLSLIFSLIGSRKNEIGIHTTCSAWIHNLRPNKSCTTENKTGQKS